MGGAIAVTNLYVTGIFRWYRADHNPQAKTD